VFSSEYIINAYTYIVLLDRTYKLWSSYIVLIDRLLKSAYQCGSIL